MKQAELQLMDAVPVFGFVVDLLCQVELAEQVRHTRGKDVRWERRGEKI
jgi:hypothetical protein